jgi:hypothetical protein
LSPRGERSLDGDALIDCGKALPVLQSAPTIACNVAQAVETPIAWH